MSWLDDLARAGESAWARKGEPAVAVPLNPALANEAVQVAAASGAREALLAFGAELETRASVEDGMAREAFLEASRRARRRAAGTSDAAEPRQPWDGLGPAQAYSAGRRAERERIAQLAEDRDACYQITPGSDIPFAVLIREATDG